MLTSAVSNLDLSDSLPMVPILIPGQTAAILYQMELSLLLEASAIAR